MQALACSASALAGCGGASYVHSNAALERVVVYKNGVAYFERLAEVDDGRVRISVPSELADDVLKSLRLLDAATGQPAPIGYPSIEGNSRDGRVDIDLRLAPDAPRHVRLSYVTESPAWKPTYRVAVRAGGKVDIEGWAIVDNTSGEDWRDVRLGVASSSALSFRYDLRSVRPVLRDTLLSSDRFALAPPTGDATYGEARVLGELGEATVREQRGGRGPEDASELVGELTALRGNVAAMLDTARQSRDVVLTLCLNDKLAQLDVAVRTANEHGRSLGAAVGARDDELATHETAILGVLSRRASALATEAQQCVGSDAGYVGGTTVLTQIDPGLPDEENTEPVWGRPKHGETDDRAAPEPPPSPIAALADRLNGELRERRIRIEGRGIAGDADPERAGLRRAEAARAELVRMGVAADRIEAVGRGGVVEPSAAVRVVEIADARPAAASVEATGADPIGSAHFEAKWPMDVASGHAAMIEILQTETEGEIVYYYDPESDRGNAEFPFRAVRLVNPTDSTLESGPLSVFGDGNFIGEGLSLPIPARSTAFVPFALDRQIVVSRHPSEENRIGRVLAVEHGVFSTEVLQSRVTTLELHSRSSEDTVVYVRHTPSAGYRVVGAEAAERIGQSYLFQVALGPHGARELVIEEATTVLETIDIQAPEGAALLRAYATRDDAADVASLQHDVLELLEQGESLAGAKRRIVETRDRLGAQRQLARDLREELALLDAGEAKKGAAPKAPRPLAKSLSERLETLEAELATVTEALVALQEDAIERRARFDEALATLRLAVPSGEAVSRTP